MNKCMKGIRTFYPAQFVQAGCQNRARRLRASCTLALLLFMLLVAIKPRMLITEDYEGAAIGSYQAAPLAGFLILAGFLCGIVLWKGGIRNRTLRNASAVLSLLVMPAVSFFIFELTAENFFTVIHNRIGLVALNLCVWYSLYAFAFALCNCARAAILAVNTAAYIFAVANAFVVQFREQPIMVMDIKSFWTAMSVAGEFQYEPTVNMVLAGLLALLCDLWIWKTDFRLPGWKMRLCYTAVIAVGFGWCYYGMLAGDFFLKAGSDGLDFFRFNLTYETDGYMACTVKSLRYLKVDAPEGYSADAVDAIASEVGQGAGGTDGGTDSGTDNGMSGGTDGGISGEVDGGISGGTELPENIIVIMNESFSDLSVLGDFQTSEPVLPHIEELAQETRQGFVLTSVFGGGTANSEFEFLTGNSAAFLPAGTIAYQMYVEEGDSSIVSLLKNNGYRTVAFHPYRKDNYNRPAVYDIYGFDEYYGEGDISYEKLRKYASDQSDYEGIIQIYEDKEPGEKLFLFNVTMQNHAGYKYKKYKGKVTLTDAPGQFPETEQFLSLMQESDRAFQGLIDYFSQAEEDVVILLFGDHQPKLEDGFYDLAMGEETAENSFERMQRKFLTPYVLWANYELDAGQEEYISANFLGSYLLDAIGVELPIYNQYLLELRESIPAMNAYGFLDEDYGMHWLYEEGEYQEMLEQYWMFEYNNLFDSRNRRKELFE